jgi:hypothetical protein
MWPSHVSLAVLSLAFVLKQAVATQQVVTVERWLLASAEATLIGGEERTDGHLEDVRRVSVLDDLTRSVAHGSCSPPVSVVSVHPG